MQQQDQSVVTGPQNAQKKPRVNRQADGVMATGLFHRPTTAKRRYNSAKHVKNQGDHFTSYALIKRFFDRIFDNADFAKPENLTHFIRAMSDDVKVSMRKLFAVYDILPEPRKYEDKEIEKLLRNATKLADQYHTARSSNAALRKQHELFVQDPVMQQSYADKSLRIIREILATGDATSGKIVDIIEHFAGGKVSKPDLDDRLWVQSDLIELHEAGQLTPEKIYQVIKNHKLTYADWAADSIQKNYSANAALLAKASGLLSDYAMRCINRFRFVAANRPKDRPAKRAGKLSEGSVLTHLDERFAARCFIANPFAEAEAAPVPLSSGRLMASIDGLLDCVQVPSPDASGDPAFRNNDPAVVASLVAKHLYIFFSVYPEAAEPYDCEFYAAQPDLRRLRAEVVAPFVDFFLDTYWPSIKACAKTTKQFHRQVQEQFTTLVEIPGNAAIAAISSLLDVDSEEDEPTAVASSDHGGKRRATMGK